MPYRAELKRPDLKGEFRCSLCQKIFCHSSSLSRHRMQAHFKCYTCTFCEKAISSGWWDWPWDSAGMDAPEAGEDPKAKKPYKELNLAEKVALITMAEENPAMSQADLARVFGIAKSNVCRVLKRRVEYVSVFRSDAFSGERKRKLRDSDTRELNALLAAWLRDRVLTGRPVSGALLQDHARRLAPRLGLHSFVASNGWLQSFQKSYVNLPRLPSSTNHSSPTLRAHPTTAALLAIRKPPPPTLDENNNPTPSAQSAQQADGGNETLRAHMLKQHQITRMFMCRCCNWAFPDKTSLHIHMQAMASGSPGNVSVIAKSSIDAEPGQALLDYDDESMDLNDPPSMLRKEDLIARLNGARSRESGDSTGEEEDGEEGGMDTNAWLTNNFPEVDASGVGSLGGTLCLAEEEEAMEEARGGEERADSGYDEDRVEEEKSAAQAAAPEFRPSPLNSLLYRKKMTPKRPLDSIFPSGDEPMPAFLKREESPSNTSASSCHPSPPNSHSQEAADGACFTCRVLKGKLVYEENRNRYLEGKVANLETKVSRLEARVVSSDATAKRHEVDSKALRDNNERLQQTLLKAQERALGFMQNGFGKPEATQSFLQDLLQATYLGSDSA